MDIAPRHWLLAILGALAAHLLALAGVWLAHLPVQPPKNTPRGVMVSLDNLNAGPPPPAASIENMPIENVAPNNTVGHIPAASAPSPNSQEAPSPAAPEAAPSVGPEPSGAPPGAPSAAPTPGNIANAGSSATSSNAPVPAIASAVTVRPSDTLADIRPQQQVTARKARLNAPGATTKSKNQHHNGASGSSEQATDDYIVRLRGWLSRHKQYPQAARRNKIQGKVRLYVVIDRSGHVVSHRIDQSSGSKMLDQAAEQMLAHAEPLPSMPASMQRNRLELIIPVIFKLK